MQVADILRILLVSLNFNIHHVGYKGEKTQVKIKRVYLLKKLTNVKHFTAKISTWGKPVFTLFMGVNTTADGLDFSTKPVQDSQN